MKTQKIDKDYKAFVFRKVFLLMTMMLLIITVSISFSTSALDATGSCGNNATYSYNSTTGELVISGEGIVTYYDWEASPFYNSDIKSVIIEDGIENIGSSLFENCTGLTSITIPDSVTRIGSFAFKNCSNLKNITLPGNITVIDSYAFNDTAFFKDESNWENGILYMNNYLISAKTDIESCEIKEDTTVIASKAFYECSRLTNLSIPYGISIIDGETFSGCSGLKSITIPDSVTNIGISAFFGCSSLTSVIIPDGVNYICNSAFSFCSSLTSIMIPDSVIRIDIFAFSGCPNLKDVYYTGSEASWNSIRITPSGNNYLISSTKHFNWDPSEAITTEPVTEPSVKPSAKPSVMPSVSNTATTAVPSVKPSVTVPSTTEKEETETVKIKKPAKVKIKNVKSLKKKNAVVIWNAVKNVNGYEVQCSTSKKFPKKTTKKVTIKRLKIKKTTIRKLRSNKKYFIRVRAFRLINGKNIYGAWSKAKTVKIK